LFYNVTEGQSGQWVYHGGNGIGHDGWGKGGRREEGEMKEIQGKELSNPTYILYQHTEKKHLGEEILARKEKGKR
jgi:hypothetical protein